jgi:hypothetical protein
MADRRSPFVGGAGTATVAPRVIFARWRVPRVLPEGKIKAIDSSRTNRIVKVGDVKLEVEPTTVVLVGCKAATVADLKVGTQIKAAYAEKAPNRQLAGVIEAQN